MRPERLIGRGWPKAGAAWSTTWRGKRPPESQLAEVSATLVSAQVGHLIGLPTVTLTPPLPLTPNQVERLIGLLKELPSRRKAGSCRTKVQWLATAEKEHAYLSKPRARAKAAGKAKG
eukprot:scaffold35385_cov57-Phaeocystis_antarctica.AAC.3